VHIIELAFFMGEGDIVAGSELGCTTDRSSCNVLLHNHYSSLLKPRAVGPRAVHHTMIDVEIPSISIKIDAQKSVILNFGTKRAQEALTENKIIISSRGDMHPSRTLQVLL